jgi:DNA-directed RNA polymerase sigma subunit (sigma70/sigma32)
MDGAGDVSQVLLEYTMAVHRLVDRLNEQVEWNERLMAELERDRPLDRALQANDSAKCSLSMTNQLGDFERARFVMRMGVAQALRAQGRTDLEIAELFGVSRQLVHRILAGNGDERS